MPDGTWVVRHVPIFACHDFKGQAPSDKSKIPVDERWMYSAVEMQRDWKKKSGWLPKIVIGHNDERERPVVCEMDNYAFDASDRQLYADYVNIREEDLEVLKRFPDRSAEPFMHKPGVPVVALLGATPGFFKLAPIRFSDDSARAIFQGNDARASYSLENAMMPKADSDNQPDPKKQEGGAMDKVSPEEKADYEKFCRYMGMYEDSKKTQVGGEELPAKDDPESNPDLDTKEPKVADKTEPKKEEGKFADTEARAQYAELSGKYEKMLARVDELTATNITLKDESERAKWTAKYSETRLPRGVLDVKAKVDFMMKLPSELRAAYFDDSVKSFAAPSEKKLDKTDQTTGKPEPGSAEEAEAVGKYWEEGRAKGTFKTFGEAQSHYIRTQR